MKRISLILTIALISIYSFTSAQFTILGNITDKSNGETLPGAHISISGTYINTISDHHGNFKINGLKAGDYTLHVTYIGYASYSEQLSITTNTELEIQLESTAIMEEEVVISATRVQQNSPVTYTDVDKNEIQQMNLGKDIPYIVSFTPSITTTSDAGNNIGYSQLRIRGTDITRINVTINGIPLNDPESHNVYWVDVPDFSSSINNIQIQRGVGTSTNGAAAFGASLNIQTQTLEQDPYAAIDNSFGSFNSRKHTLMAGTGLIKDKFAFDVRLSNIASDGYIDRAASDLRSFFVSGALYGKDNILKLNIFSGREETYQAWEGVPKDSLETNRTYNPAGEFIDDDGNISYYDNQTDNYNQDHFQLLFSQQIGTVNLNLAAFYVKGKGYYESWKNDQKLSNYGESYFVEDTSVTRSDLIRQKWLDNDFSGITFSGSWDPKKKIKLSVGGAYNNYVGDHFGYVIWAKDALILNPEEPYYFNKGKKSDFNVYTKMNWLVALKLNLYVDLQYRHINYSVTGNHDNLNEIDINQTYSFFNPRTGIFYEINNQNKTYLSFGIANREPNRRNFIDADPGQIPTYETLYDFELGYDYSIEKLNLGLNVYYMYYHNQLVETGKINNVGDPVMVNVPKSHRTGLEFTAGARIGKNFKWNANLTLSRNKIKSYTEFIDNWDTWGQDIWELENTEISFSPNVIAYNLFSYEVIDNMYVKLESKYISKQYIDNTSSEKRKLDPYFVNNIIFNYLIHTSFIEEIGVDLLVNNIFNSRYESNAWVYKYIYEGQEQEYNGYFPQAGINFMVGLHLRF